MPMTGTLSKLQLGQTSRWDWTSICTILDTTDFRQVQETPPPRHALLLITPAHTIVYSNCPIVIQNNNIFNIVIFSACVLWAKLSVTCLLKTVSGVEDISDQEPNSGLNFVTASSTVLQKWRVTQPVTAFPYIYETPNFITVDKTARQWSLSWARRIQSTQRLLQIPF